MFVLLISVYLMNARRLSWSAINSGIYCNDCQRQGTHRNENWPAAKVIVAIIAGALEKILPIVTCLVPSYGPIVVALMIGCITLVVRNSQGLNSNKGDETQEVEDAA